MGEEVKMTDLDGGAAAAEDEEERVLEWEEGLPSLEDLTPLSQSLVPPELASAFSISPVPCRSILDVNRASENTLSGLRGQPLAFSSSNLKLSGEDKVRDSVVVEEDDMFSRKLRRINSIEEADSEARTEGLAEDSSGGGKPTTTKRPRLVWTPQLHKRFVDVVAHLGIKNAVPKTIMQLMNVDGLTRENVASHLQKYRLYLKRMQGLSDEGPSASDQLFASTPVPQDSGVNRNGNGNRNGDGHLPPVPMPMQYSTPMMPMPISGMAHGQGMHPGASIYHGFDSSSYGNGMFQQRDWPGNKLGSVMAYSPHLTHNDK